MSSGKTLLKEFYGGFVTLFLSGQSTIYFQKNTFLMLIDIIMFNPMNWIELATEVTIFFHGLTFQHMFRQFIFRVDEV
jgi:hypothetical protein